MKKFMKIAFVAVFVAVAGYGVYASQKADVMSDLVLANVEALADAEIDGTNCNATWNRECCVCFGRHHKFAIPRTTTGACEHKTCSTHSY